MRLTDPPADATSVVYTAKADRFPTVARCLGALILPPAVWEEAVDAADHGRPDVQRILAAEGSGFVRRALLPESVRSLSDEIERSFGLGAGESQVLAMAVSGSRQAIVDDRAARRIAVRLGIIHFRTVEIAVVGRAYGLLSLAEAQELLHALAIPAPLKAADMLALERLIEEDRHGE